MSFDLKDVYAIEGDAEDEEQYFTSLQRAINSLSAWRLQGSYGRAMMDAIKAGRCMLGRADCSDYWGNHIPSRTDVREGTSGSRSFVAECHGKEWAQKMEEVE